MSEQCNHVVVFWERFDAGAMDHAVSRTIPLAVYVVVFPLFDVVHTIRVFVLHRSTPVQ